MGLASFDTLMFADIGSVVEQHDTREIRRIEGHGKAAYLKRRLASSIPTSLEMYLLGQRAHTASFNEYLHIQALQKHRFSVMNAMTAGEHHWFGLPRCGFILAEEVRGSQLDHFLTQCEPDEREKLLQLYGRLVAQLHRSGFYCPLRLKDIIATDDQRSLVMIDRETRYPYPRKYSPYRARKALNVTFRRIQRSLPSFNHSQRQIILQAYREAGGPE